MLTPQVLNKFLPHWAPVDAVCPPHSLPSSQFPAETDHRVAVPPQAVPAVIYLLCLPQLCDVGCQGLKAALGAEVHKPQLGRAG